MSKGARCRLPYQTETASRSLPVSSTPPEGHEVSRLAPSSTMIGRHRRGVGPRPGRSGPASQPESSTVTERPIDLGDPAEDHARVDRQPHRLVERGRGEIEVERAVGIAPVAVEVPVAGIEQVEAAELEPGPPVVGGGGEIVAQQVDGHLPLALALERGRAGRHVGIDGALGADAGRAASASSRASSRRREARRTIGRRPPRRVELGACISIMLMDFELR